MHNCAFMHNCYSNRVYIHGYYSMCICYFINFHSHFFFLSLLRAQPTNSVFLSSSSFSLDAQKQIHPHLHTNKPTRTNQQWDRSKLVGLDRCLIGARGSWPMLDRSLWVRSALDWSSSWSVLEERSELVGLLLERSLIEMGLAWLRWVLLDRS